MIVTVGVFYLIAIYFQAIGFGLGPSGVTRFAQSSGAPQRPGEHLLRHADDGGHRRRGDGFAVCICSGHGNRSTRLLFALGRDSLISSRFGHVDEVTAAPRFAMATTIVIGVVGNVVLYFVGVSSENVFGYLGTVGVLALLLVYLATQVGAVALFRNIWRVPAAPYSIFPYLVLG